MVKSSKSLEEIFSRIRASRMVLMVMEEAEEAELERHAGRAQASLDLEAGRLVRAVEYRGRDKRWLLLAIHHLVIDGVSWRILLEDLERGYEQCAAGREIDWGRKTTSLRQWSERLAEYAAGEELGRQVEYWSGPALRGARHLPVDWEGGAERNLTAAQESVEGELEAEETRALLQEVPSVYNTQINDVLLTALERALEDWAGREPLLVDLEGHGREDLFPDIDVSRTVGWFTSAYPVALGGRVGVWEPAKALSTVKERLRAVPGRGLGYGVLRYLGPDEGVRRRLAETPAAGIVFNYLGQVDQVLRGSALFAPSALSAGPTVAPENRRPYPLDISAIVAGGQLRLTCRYSARLHRRATVETLLRRFLDALRLLLAHCRSDRAGGFTPSDFEVAAMTQDQLEELASFLN